MKKRIVPILLIAAVAYLALQPSDDASKTVTAIQKQNRKINFLKA
ncbi:MAG: hypothetical protein ACK5XN_05640 [Bacteroidota bacterium]|jgi:hypothetical protein